MEEKYLFDLVLDKDEEILKLYRPNKFRAWFSAIIMACVLALIFVCISIISMLDEDEIALGCTILILYVIFAVLYVIMMKLWLNKTVYAVTNKRILIRTGYIGVDYKSLDFNMLGAMTVNVSLLDKLLKKNTGSIAFGSMSSPITNSASAKFSFSYIANPYKEYKEIKAIIDENK